MSKPNAPKEGNGYHSGRKLPKAEKARTLSLKGGKNAIEFATKQNTMDDGQLAQLPSGRNHKTTTSSGN